MRCDDADVMMMQKEKQAKSNLGKNPGALHNRFAVFWFNKIIISLSIEAVFGELGIQQTESAATAQPPLSAVERAALVSLAVRR